MGETSRDEELFAIDEGIYMKILEGVKPIHPAQDYSGETAYMGVWRLVQVVSEKRQRPFKSPLNYALFLVSSKREVIPAIPNKLVERGIFLEYVPRMKFLGGWSEEGVRKFIEGYLPAPKEVWDDVTRLLKEYVHFEREETYILVAIWIIGSFFFSIFETWPYLYVGGPKGVGKTRTLRVIRLLSFNGIDTSNITEASLFRLVQSLRAAICIDEASVLAKEGGRRALKELLYAGYKKMGTVVRTEKTSSGALVTTMFEVYSPKALANIEGIGDIMADRAIFVYMVKCRDPRIVNKELRPENPVWRRVKDKLYAFALTHWKEVRELAETDWGEEEFIGRTKELWNPILAMAAFLERHGIGPLLERMKAYAKEKEEQRILDERVENVDMLVLRYLVKRVERGGWYALTDLIEGLKEEYGLTGKERWLRARGMGRRLNRLGVLKKRLRKGRTEYFLDPERVRKMGERYDVDVGTAIKEAKEEGGLLLRDALAWMRLYRRFELDELREWLKSREEDPTLAERLVELARKEGVLIERSDGSYEVV